VHSRLNQPLERNECDHDSKWSLLSSQEWLKWNMEQDERKIPSRINHFQKSRQWTRLYLAHKLKRSPYLSSLLSQPYNVEIEAKQSSIKEQDQMQYIRIWNMFGIFFRERDTAISFEVLAEKQVSLITDSKWKNLTSATRTITWLRMFIGHSQHFSRSTLNMVWHSPGLGHTQPGFAIRLSF
jgi:hypothetical protein